MSKKAKLVGRPFKVASGITVQFNSRGDLVSPQKDSTEGSYVLVPSKQVIALQKLASLKIMCEDAAAKLEKVAYASGKSEGYDIDESDQLDGIAVGCQHVTWEEVLSAVKHKPRK